MKNLNQCFDSYPDKRDYDFNDLVLNYQYNTITNAANQVVEVRYNFVTRAVGGSLHNGFAFQLDSINPNKITSVTGSKAVGASWLQLNSNGTEASQGDNANIVVFDDAYKLLPTQAGFSFINTYQGSPDSGKDTTSIVVKFIDNGVVPTGGAINYSSFGLRCVGLLWYAQGAPLLTACTSDVISDYCGQLSGLAILTSSTNPTTLTANIRECKHNLRT
jgi:LruC domain-containing protein